MSISQRHLLPLQKLLAAGGYSIFFWRVLQELWISPKLDPTLIALALGEGITIFIILLAKPSKSYDFTLISAVSTISATFYFLFITLTPGQEILDRRIATIGQTIAITWQIWAKIYLGRSFGLMPANRGIVTSGPYKIVRHPIYFGYFLNHLFLLLGNFSIHNLLIYSGVYFLQGVRIWKEELLLKQDPEYIEYMKKTNYRFIPLIF